MKRVQTLFVVVPVQMFAELTREEIAGLFLYTHTSTVTTVATIAGKSTPREFLTNKIQNLRVSAQ
jgi:hypothetical protein